MVHLKEWHIFINESEDFRNSYTNKFQFPISWEDYQYYLETMNTKKGTKEKLIIDWLIGSFHGGKEDYDQGWRAKYRADYKREPYQQIDSDTKLVYDLLGNASDEMNDDRFDENVVNGADWEEISAKYLLDPLNEALSEEEFTKSAIKGAIELHMKDPIGFAEWWASINPTLKELITPNIKDIDISKETIDHLVRMKELGLL